MQKFGALGMALVFLSSCSFFATRPPPSDYKPPAEVSCGDTTYLSPSLDALGAVSMAAWAIFAATVQPAPGFTGPDIRPVGIPVTASLSLAGAVSAVYGFRNTATCRPLAEEKRRAEVAAIAAAEVAKRIEDQAAKAARLKEIEDAERAEAAARANLKKVVLSVTAVNATSTENIIRLDTQNRGEGQKFTLLLVAPTRLLPMTSTRPEVFEGRAGDVVVLSGSILLMGAVRPMTPFEITLDESKSLDVIVDFDTALGLHRMNPRWRALDPNNKQ